MKLINKSSKKRCRDSSNEVVDDDNGAKNVKRTRLNNDDCDNDNEDNNNIWDVLSNVEIRTGEEWVSGTRIRNYMLNDPIMDWLDLYYRNYGFNEGKGDNKNKKEVDIMVSKERTKMNVLFANGIIFEDSVFEDLKEKYPRHHVQIGYSHDDVTDENYQKTMTYMKAGMPLILQAVLINKNNKTRGMADLLVRSDFFNELFGENQLTDDEINIPSPTLGIDFHYRVIDIKWTTINLCSDGKLIRNDGRIPAYKGQLAIYNCIVGNMQGYFPEKTYILGHSWKFETCGDKFNGHNCFDLLGHIDYGGFDANYINRTVDAIKWIRNLHENGMNWKLVPPSIPELYPNMSNTNDTPWSQVKTLISNKIQELTQLWQVGPKNRVIGHSNGVYKWSDRKCNAKNLGINGKKIGPILNKIITVNRSKRNKISPKVITNNDMNWQESNALDFYIDFETVNGCFINEPTNIYDGKTDTNVIFMIGIGYSSNGKWIYKSFVMETLDIENESKIIDDLVTFIGSITKNGTAQPRFFHWSNAEVTSLNIANRRHGYKWTEWFNDIIWIDLCKIFQKEPIVVNGAFKFKLKSIAKAMHKHKFIETTWKDDGISDGLSAMLDAIDYYKAKIKEEGDQKVIDNIEEYNEIDCKVMWEIVVYLRANHNCLEKSKRLKK